MLLKKNTQHATSKVYAFVPIQNFTSKGDIDWSKSIPEINQQLYVKYHLTDEEIAFIENDDKANVKNKVQVCGNFVIVKIHT